MNVVDENEDKTPTQLWMSENKNKHKREGIHRVSHD